MGVGTANAFGLTQYSGVDGSFFSHGAYLSEGAGYGIILGVSGAFILLVLALVWADSRYGDTRYHSEEFNTAGRTIKTGLIAVDITSHWTWSSTMLQSTNQAFQYGVSGGLWFAAGAVIQIFFFGPVAVEIKRRAPFCHTVLEIVASRWGNGPRVIFLYFLLITNVIVSAQLILGGSAVISALTGVNIYAAVFLIPIGVLIYTCVGGLKATFTSSYVHTVIIFIGLCLFGFVTYATGHVLGSPGAMYDHLQYISQLHPVDGNRHGSYLTLFSLSGIKFGILQVMSCWGIVFADQAYWQSAIAARPTAAWKGYILGGLMWYAVPFGLATSLGLTVKALDLPLTSKEANSGLVPAAAGLAILGKGGGVVVAIMVLMAITSSGSAEMVAISSLLTYDVYIPFIRKNKNPSGKLA
ncbi:hypothetical protein WJX73_003550 [Symbiochloris irregularis]|uniref:Urea active transporter 1 n=1 Tax=Symbiochloris irregularis TaxID=706552 RepID=A0AAW1PVL0_9CHLO